MADAKAQEMFILWQRIPSGHWHDVHQERRIDTVVLFEQVQEEFPVFEERRAQTQMDHLFREGRERKGVSPSDRWGWTYRFSTTTISLS